MLAKEKMQLIQELKLQGYTQSDITSYFTEHGMRPPSRRRYRSSANSLDRQQGEHHPIWLSGDRKGHDRHRVRFQSDQRRVYRLL